MTTQQMIMGRGLKKIYKVSITWMIGHILCFCFSLLLFFFFHNFIFLALKRLTMI